MRFLFQGFGVLNDSIVKLTTLIVTLAHFEQQSQIVRLYPIALVVMLQSPLDVFSLIFLHKNVTLHFLDLCDLKVIVGLDAVIQLVLGFVWSQEIIAQDLSESKLSLGHFVETFKLQGARLVIPIQPARRRWFGLLSPCVVRQVLGNLGDCVILRNVLFAGKLSLLLYQVI